MKKNMKVGITGISGRMGSLLAKEIINSRTLEIGGALADVDNRGNNEDIGEFIGLKNIGIKITNDLEKLFNDCDGIIDFTAPELTMKCVEICAKKHKKMVIGTTGLTNEQITRIKEFSKDCAVVQSGNMSIGINLLLNIIEEAAKVLGSDYDIEVMEMHHKHKKDAPSGTAIMLGKAAANGRNFDFDKVARKSRDGIIGERPENEIGFATLRGGSVVGDHTVIFAGQDERIEFSHLAGSRQIFVSGALRAMEWLNTQKEGMYNMREVLR